MEYVPCPIAGSKLAPGELRVTDVLRDQVWSRLTMDINFRPKQIDSTAFIAPGAVVVGDVTIGADSSVWFSAVIRGDT